MNSLHLLCFTAGGARTCKVVVAPDPLLFDHLIAHGVVVDGAPGSSEQARLGRAFTAQVGCFVCCTVLF